MSGKKTRLKKGATVRQKDATVHLNPLNSKKKTENNPENFLHFIFKNRSNQKLLLVGIIINILFFALYKYCIPMPDFFSDGHGYVLAAAKNLELYYRPLGYSRLLDLLHGFSSLSLFTVGFQYFLLVFAAHFLFFTTDYLFGFKRKLFKYSAFILMGINPILLVLSNQIASDSAFTAFTILWFASLLWILKRGGWLPLILQIIFLYWSFELRYNALYYPAISIATFLLIKNAKIHYRLLGILITTFVIWGAYHSEKQTTERVTGAPVFTGFSGWMMANNALLIYPHLNVETPEFDDADLQLMDQFVKRFIDSISPAEKADLKKYKLGWPYFWNKNAPLKRYLYYYMQKYKVPYFQAWYQVSPLFYNYGKTIIRNHPLIYFRYFTWPNIQYFFLPRKFEMESYLMNDVHTVPKETEEWFRFKSDRLISNYPNIQRIITSIYLPLHALIMLLSLSIPLYSLLLKRKVKEKNTQNSKTMFWFWLIFWGFSLAFSILAGPIVLRYQIGLFIIGCSTSLWLLDQLLLKQSTKKKDMLIQPQ